MSDTNQQQQSYPIPCQRSGLCCVHLVGTGSLDVSDEDVERWEREGRSDILEWVSILRGPDGTIVMADFPVAADGEGADQCPFLAWENDLAACEIHDTKPYICREFHCAARGFAEGGAYKLAESLYERHLREQAGCRADGR